jgi:hypothetical protein
MTSFIDITHRAVAITARAQPAYQGPWVTAMTLKLLP